MNTENPYAAGNAPTELPSEAPLEIELLPTPLGNAAGRSFEWLKAGFGDFARGPWAHVAFLVLLFVAAIVISGASNFGFLIDPVFGFVVNTGTSLAMNLLLYVIMAGFLLTVRQARATGRVQFETFFAGFQHPRLGALLGLAGIYLLVTVIIVAAFFVVFFFAIGPEAFGDFFVSAWMNPYGDVPSMALGEDALVTLLIVGFVVGTLILVVVGMLFFFAGHLVTFSDESVFDAMKLSFIGCLRNIVPLLLWAVLAFVLTILGGLLCGLGLLVVAPAVWASTYQAFLDIFAREGAR